MKFDDQHLIYALAVVRAADALVTCDEDKTSSLYRYRAMRAALTKEVKAYRERYPITE